MAGIVEQLKRRFGRLRGDRGTWEQHWQEVAEIFQPRHAEFNRTWAPGEKRNQRIFESVPTLVPFRFSAAFESMMTPQGSLWHGLKTSDDDLNEWGPVKQWLGEVRKRMFRHRYNARSGFVGSTGEAYVTLGLYGTMCVYSEEGFNRAPIEYTAVPLSQIYIEQSGQGLIDTTFRFHKMSPRQMAQKWGERRLSAKSRKALGDPVNMDLRANILSVCMPRNSMTEGYGYDAMPFVTFHIEYDDDHLAAVGGYWENPFFVSRYAQSASEIYGRGPGILSLPSGKMLNAMKATTMRAAEKSVDPPLAIADTGVMQRPNLNPGKLNPGAIDQNGRLRIQPIGTNSRPDVGEAMMDVERNAIEDAFWVTVFRILAEQPSMTATEVLERAKEKGELMGPTIGKQETEFVAPMVERDFKILLRKRLLPPPPQEVWDAGLRVDHTSPMSRMRRASEGVGIVRTLEVASGVAAYKPDVMDNFDMDRMIRDVAEINGMPASGMRDKAEVRQIREKRAADEAAEKIGQNMALAAQSAGSAAPMVKALGEVTQQ